MIRQPKTSPNAAELPNATLIKRLAAMLYDSLIIAALWMMVGAVAVGLNDGEAAEGPLFKSALFLVTFLFFRAVLDLEWPDPRDAGLAVADPNRRWSGDQRAASTDPLLQRRIVATLPRCRLLVDADR